MAVDLLGAPAERFETLFVGGKIVTECGFLALAEPVDVDDGNEVVELVNAGQ